MDDKIARQVHDRYQDTGQIHPYLKPLVGPQRVSWRLLLIGSTVWAPTGKGWTAATVERLGKSRDDRTVVYLTLHGTRGNRHGQRYASQLFWRRGKDKPKS